MKSEINKRVTYYRKKAHLTQAETAVLLEMKSSTYSQMEREGDISAQRIIKLADIFKIDVKMLLYGETTIDPKKLPNPIEDMVVLPKLPCGMKYIAVNNLVNSIVTVYSHFPKKHKDIVCDIMNFLNKHKKVTLLQKNENHIEIFE